MVNGRWVGYAITAECEHPDCSEEIDRGLAYACGGEHGDGEDFCDGYFCGSHLFKTNGIPGPFRCEECIDTDSLEFRHQ